MLARILEEMWVEPEVLEALNEEQKRILFLKMREEQVRRWREWEDKMEEVGADCHSARQEKGSMKRVHWLQGPDGDVSVSVIGEENDLGSSKVLTGLLRQGLESASMNGIQTVALLPEREAHHHHSRRDLQPPPTASDLTTPHEYSFGEEVNCDAAEDGLKDPAEGSDSKSGSNTDNLTPWIPIHRPHFSNHGNWTPLEPQLSNAKKSHPYNESETGREERQRSSEPEMVLLCQEKPAHPGKTINNPSVPVYWKPPVPIKSPHLKDLMKNTGPVF